MELPGRAVLVTGGAVRIGEAISMRLAAVGCRVFIHHNNSASAARELRDRIRSDGGVAETGTADLAQPDAATDLLREAGSALGPLSLLVNNASGFPADRLEDVAYEQFRRSMDLTLAGPLFLTQQWAAALPPDMPGAIVNVTDVKIERPDPAHLSYGLAKSGLDALTRAAALALAPRVRVNAVELGNILPPTVSGAGVGTDPDLAAELAAAVPLRRLGGAAPVAEAVEFLLSNDFITGETLRLDGGAHLR